MFDTVVGIRFTLLQKTRYDSNPKQRHRRTALAVFHAPRRSVFPCLSSFPLGGFKRSATQSVGRSHSSIRETLAWGP
jgi:hypothetical protein